MRARKKKPKLSAANRHRRYHRTAALICAAPLLIIVCTGLLLQLKGWMGWVQPPSAQGHPYSMTVPLDRVLTAAMSVPEAQVKSWKDIRVLDVRPAQGVMRARAANGYEVQIDSETGEVLHAGMRGATLLIAIHEGSWFGSIVRYWIFVPAAFLLLFLWITGLYIYLRPFLATLGSSARQRRLTETRSV